MRGRSRKGRRAVTDYLDGVDVSSYQGPHIDWPRVRSAGIAWAYAKAEEGVTVIDATFPGNLARGRAAGLRVGPYLFRRASSTPAAEVARFVPLILAAGWTPEDMPPAVDVETKGSGESDADVARAACEILHALRGALGVTPVLYTYLDFARVFRVAPELAAFPLWLAAYTSHPPVAPEPWASAGWWAHQYSGGAIVPGVPAPCDRSRAVSLP